MSDGAFYHSDGGDDRPILFDDGEFTIYEEGIVVSRTSTPMRFIRVALDLAGGIVRLPAVIFKNNRFAGLYENDEVLAAVVGDLSDGDPDDDPDGAE